MLYPQSNASRTVLDLSGVWNFRLTKDEPWQNIAVPASYNDQSPDPRFRAHAGLAWYKTPVTVPALFAGQRLVLRFDAVTHYARIFLNGMLLCEHRGGYLPFEADITDKVNPGETFILEVEVDNRINHSTLPIGTEGATAFFGSDAYSKEELIAEIGAAALVNRCGLETAKSFRNSAAYIQNWLQALKNDKRFIVSAAGKAEKAVALILGE